jgi:hypothetical protein
MTSEQAAKLRKEVDLGIAFKIISGALPITDPYWETISSYEEWKQAVWSSQNGSPFRAFALAKAFEKSSGWQQRKEVYESLAGREGSIAKAAFDSLSEFADNCDRWLFLTHSDDSVVRGKAITEAKRLATSFSHKMALHQLVPDGSLLDDMVELATNAEELKSVLRVAPDPSPQQILALERLDGFIQTYKNWEKLASDSTNLKYRGIILFVMLKKAATVKELHGVLGWRFESSSDLMAAVLEKAKIITATFEELIQGANTTDNLDLSKIFLGRMFAEAKTIAQWQSVYYAARTGEDKKKALDEITRLAQA